MGECMSFPEKPEEFIKQYMFKDTEEIYTNGSELIPVFRVNQMIEHYFNPIDSDELLDILNMSNQEAAEILIKMAVNVQFGRGSGKTMTILRVQKALLKAINILENTPDTVTDVPICKELRDNQIAKDIINMTNKEAAKIINSNFVGFQEEEI